MKILQKNNKKLRILSESVGEINSEIKKLAIDLYISLRKVGGLGLAAPQIGVNKRVVIAMLNSNGKVNSGNPTTMINPVISNKSEDVNVDIEGCLSIKDVNDYVPRHTSITVTYINTKGVMETKDLTGLDARIVQHEVDHLDGILFTDKVVVYG